MSNYFTKDDAVDIILDTLNGNPNIYPEEIFERSFNEDYYIIGYYKAEQALRNSQWGIFGAIGLISNYEQSEFGEVNTDLSDCEKVPICWNTLLAKTFGQIFNTPLKTKLELI